MISDYLYAKASAKRVPLSGGFELSPICNFQCKMCYVRRTPGDITRAGKRLRTPEEWLSLARQCRDAGMLYLLLTGGEPFAYTGFRSLYEQLHDMGLVISINSNGSLITEETVEWLKERMPSRVNVTLYGASPETYGRVCGNPAGYEKAVNAIRMLNAAGIPVVINASMIPENSADLEAIAAFGKELDLNTRIAPYMFPPVKRTREDTDSRADPAEAASLMLRKCRAQLGTDEFRNYLEEHLAAAKEPPQPTEPGTWGESFEEEHMRCRAGRSSFWVNWDGTMTACAMMEFPAAAKPFERPFSECWQEINKAVRQATVLSECASCAKKHLCRPCTAMLVAETGDANKKAPYLCEMTDRTLELMKKELEGPEK